MHEFKNDDSIISAQRDIATVTASGSSLSKVISGVSIHSPINHVDHRGRVFEIYPGETEHWCDPIVYCYLFTVRSGQTKGWGLHLEKDDRYTLITGELLTVLYDARQDSPTHGLVQKVFLTAQGVRQLRIPAGVWHMNIALGDSEAFLINHPTKVYQHENPDRLLLPFNTDKIPIDVSSFLPRQLN
jgi:dTDP-4-dehydrorhamnose 3,5-epimerase